MLTDKLMSLINLPNTYLGEAPIAVDDCQWIRPAAGNSKLFFCKSTYDKPAFSIYVRDKDSAKALCRGGELLKKLQGYTDSTSALVVTRLLSFVGKDEKHRSIYTFSIEYQTGGY